MTVETLIIIVLLVLLIRVMRPGRRRRRHSRFYDWYLKSSLWKTRRAIWYWTSNRRCERCRRRMVLHPRGMRYRMGAETVTVHHRNYRRLGYEHRSDVQLLCWPCHKRQDSWRHR